MAGAKLRLMIQRKMSLESLKKSTEQNATALGSLS